MISDRKTHPSERVPGAEKSLLERFREELEGLHTNTTGVARKKSVVAKMRAIRNAYMARTSIFFRTDFSGVVRFMPHAGKKFLKMLFIARAGKH